MNIFDGFGNLGTLINQRGLDVDPGWLIQLIRDELSLKNVAYLALHAPPLTRFNFYSLVTYSNEWVERYISQGYVKIDPVIPAASAGILPVDWNEIDRSKSNISDFF